MDVSAIIPSYESAHLLPRAVESVLGQSLPVAELIVVDDGSTDGTAEIVAKRYGTRCRLLRQENRGVAAARNLGIRQARTEWVGLLDADDEWLPDKNAAQLDALRRCPHAALCYAPYWAIQPDGSRRLVEPPLPDALWPSIRLANPFPPSVVLMRRRAVLDAGGYDERLKSASCEDWELNFRLARACQFVRSGAPAIHYHITPCSASTRYLFMLEREREILDRTLLEGLEGGPRQLWRRQILSLMYYRAAISSREVGESGLSYVLRSLGQWPWPSLEPRRYRTLLLALASAAGVSRVARTFR